MEPINQKSMQEASKRIAEDAAANLEAIDNEIQKMVDFAVANYIGEEVNPMLMPMFQAHMLDCCSRLAGRFAFSIASGSNGRVSQMDLVNRAMKSMTDEIVEMFQASEENDKQDEPSRIILLNEQGIIG